MNLKLLILYIVLPILVANAHLNVSAVLSKGQQFFSNVGKSAKESFNSIRREVGVLKHKVKDKVEKTLEEICKTQGNILNKLNT